MTINCQTCNKPIKFELLKDDKGQAIPKEGEFTKDGKQKYKYKPVNLDGSKHMCEAAVFEEKPAAPAPMVIGTTPAGSTPASGAFMAAGSERGKIDLPGTGKAGGAGQSIDEMLQYLCNEMDFVKRKLLELVGYMQGGD